jgi:hypothetical protein
MYCLTCFMFGSCFCYLFLSPKPCPNDILCVTWICYAHFVTSSSWNACKQHAIGCHFHPLGFMFHNSFAHTFQHHHFVFSFLVLLQHLWSFDYSSTTSMPLEIPWWNNCSTLILCVVLNHKVDIRVSILLLSSSNVGCHGITPRFSHVCVSPNVCKYITMNLLIMYSLTFVKALLLDVQLD